MGYFETHMNIMYSDQIRVFRISLVSNIYCFCVLGTFQISSTYFEIDDKLLLIRITPLCYWTRECIRCTWLCVCQSTSLRPALPTLCQLLVTAILLSTSMRFTFLVPVYEWECVIFILDDFRINYLGCRIQVALQPWWVLEMDFFNIWTMCLVLKQWRAERT